MILALRTDKPEAEIHLLTEDGVKKAEKIWIAQKTLADNLLSEIIVLMKSADIRFEDLSGLIVYKGPGSFTGLRIGVTVANTMAESLSIPIIGTKEDSWLDDGIVGLSQKEGGKIVLPEYGSEANTTKPSR